MAKDNKKALKNRNKKLAKRKKQQKDKKKEINKLNTLKTSKINDNSNDFLEIMNSTFDDNSISDNKLKEKVKSIIENNEPYNNDLADAFKGEYGKISENIIDYAYMIFGEDNNIEANLKLAMNLWNYSIYRDAEIYEDEYHKLESSLSLEFDEDDLNEFYYNKSSFYKGDIRLVASYSYDSKREYLQVLSSVNKEINNGLENATLDMISHLDKYAKMLSKNKKLKKSDLDKLDIIANKNRNDYDITILYGDCLFATRTEENLLDSIIVFKNASIIKSNELEPHIALLESYFHLGALDSVIKKYSFIEEFVSKNNSEDNISKYESFKVIYKKTLLPLVKKGLKMLGDNYDDMLKYLKGHELFEQAILNNDFSKNTILLLEKVLPLRVNNQKEYLLLTLLSLIIGDMDKFEFYNKKLEIKEHLFEIDNKINKDDLKDALVNIIINNDFF